VTRVADASAASARAIIDEGRYMTLATADAAGAPWASPVWYAPAGYGELLWVSAADARHSHNIAARPRVGIVIFDSSVQPGEGQAVYMAAEAAQVTGGDEVEAGIDRFSRRSVAQGLPAWTPAEVSAPARLRLYRALVSEHWMLGERDERVPVNPRPTLSRS
jgi:nitroimidazol reductase NimA-like FMN-containing flavoprotein (pyridoxamine 5'-phosphate oxidase superfamily)